MNSIQDGSSCLDNGCFICCIETSMPLNQNDIDRLSGLGHDDFMVIVDNERRLRNLSGACFFLEDYGCRVYQNRPEGCRLYPLVLGRSGTIGLDGEYPQADKFIFNGEDVSKLHELANRIRKKT